LEGEGFHNPDLAQVPEHEEDDEFEDDLVAASPCFGLSVDPRNQWIPILNPGSAPRKDSKGVVLPATDRLAVVAPEASPPAP
jgi:hypothetical protein